MTAPEPVDHRDVWTHQPSVAVPGGTWIAIAPDVRILIDTACNVRVGIQVRECSCVSEGSR